MQCALAIKVIDRNNDNFAAFKGYFFGKKKGKTIPLQARCGPEVW